MKTLREILFRLHGLLRREQRRNLEAEMAEERRQHLDRRTQEKIADGLSSEEARYAAQREFGGIAQVQEQCRDERHFVWLEQLAQDVRYAARSLRKSPSFTTVVVLTFALGIGANTALFTLGSSLLSRGPGGENARELVAVFLGDAKRNGTDNHSYPDYLDYRRETADVLTGLAAFTPEQANLMAGGRTERISAGYVSDNYFSVLGVGPRLGRLFLPDENLTPGASPVAVVSEDLWKREFGGTPDVLVRTVLMNNTAYQVIGVVPDEVARMMAVLKVDVFVPAVMRRDPLTERGNKEFLVMGRLKPGVALATVQARFEVIASRLSQEHPREWTVQGRPKAMTVTPASGVPFGLRGYATAFFGGLLALMGVVLMIVCTNLAGLFLSRGTARRREIATRLALGAGRGRIVRQLVAEAALLAMIGGGAAMPIAWWSGQALLALAPGIGVPLAFDLRLDAGVFVFTFLIAGGAALACGLLPAWAATRPDVVAGLKQGDGPPETSRRFSLRDLLVVAQVASSLFLLLGAGMLLRSFNKLSVLDLGFTHANVALLSVDLSLQGYSPDQGRLFHAQALERLATVPGVEVVTLARRVPIHHSRVGDRFVPEGGRVPPAEAMFGFNIVGAGYFEALKIPVRHGRAFRLDDRAGAPPVAVINEAMARLCWPGENPIGKRLLRDGGESLEVVGVCRDGKYNSLNERRQPFVFLPWAQHYTAAATFHVRTQTGAASIMPGLRQALLDIDPRLAIFDVKTLNEHLETFLLPVKIAGRLLTVFAGLAVGLAALGLYGVMAYMVVLRRREIGIRLALGAVPRRVVAGILKKGLKLTALGMVFGLVGGAGATMVVASQLYGFTGSDVLFQLALGAGMLAVALVACWFPARRAAKVDPMSALRCD